MSIKNRQNGFALIEVLVASVIIAIGVSGLGILLMRVIQSTQDSAQQSQAMWIVQDYVGRIKSNVQGAKLGLYELNLISDTYCDSPPNPICVEHFTAGAEVAAVNCTPPQMAAFDTFLTVCGISPDIFDSASDFMLNPTLISRCSSEIARSTTGTGLPDCVQYDITLTWDTRIAKTSAEAAERIQKNSFTTIVELN
jgi:type IV pilus modification protein PilV